MKNEELIKEVKEVFRKYGYIVQIVPGGVVDKFWFYKDTKYISVDIALDAQGNPESPIIDTSYSHLTDDRDINAFKKELEESFSLVDEVKKILSSYIKK